jgi:Cu+-exporting ATPase
MKGAPMGTADISVLVAAVAVMAFLGWYFFAPRRAHTAEMADGVQRVEITVRGGYQPDILRVRQNVPLELVFDRQESGDCTSHVVFPDLGVNAALPAFARTSVRVEPARAGTFGFACGMNMIHGSLIVEPASESSATVRQAPSAGAEVDSPAPSSASRTAA